MRLRIVAAVNDPPVWVLPRHEIERIASALPEADVVDARDPELRKEELPRADVLLITKLTVEEARLAARVRWIQSTAVGIGPLLRPEIVQGGIVVTNVRGVHAPFIAEHAIALALAVRRSLHVSAARQRDREWAQSEIEAIPASPAGESRMLVVGLGAIGSRVARMAAGLGFEVHAIRRRPELGGPEGVVRVVGPDRLLDELPEAEVVVLATPTTTDTRIMIGRTELAAMRKTAVLVNVARGRLVDEAALVDALERRQIAGAGLDAFVEEPLPREHALWGLPNVLMSPHSAAFGRDYWRPVIDLFLDNFRRFVRGETLLNVVDKANGY
ncbi:MAG TPA: D-2-hydroxyacid dehydrogenase [Vicinamibacterales bacterium]|nr:D-2-hydroxyacid dehydrogenase [Vicinamibacterales bacterium]